MSRRLLVINVALGIVSVVLAVGTSRTLLAKRPLPPAPPPKAASAPAAEAPAEAGDVGPGAYGTIAARTLFNPSRSDTVAVAAAAAPRVKPILYGVVVDGTKSRAFLEDPAIKRVAGYSVGDTVGGGTIQKISDDRVVIVRPDGPVEILLQDPSKPRATSAPSAAQAGPAQAGTAQSGPAQTGPVLAGPAQAGPAQVGPAQIVPAQIVPEQTGSRPNPWPPPGRQGRQRLPRQKQQGNE